jgi:acetyl-CoA synthetase
MHASPGSPYESLRQARDLLIQHRLDHASACRDFRWPRLEHFNFAFDWFDRIAESADRTALRICDPGGASRGYSFSVLSRRSNQVANLLRDSGIGRGDRVLLMLGNCVELWESMLGAMKLGAVIVPTTTLLSREELRDRLSRGNVKAVIAAHDCVPNFESLAGDWTGIVVGRQQPGWRSFSLSESMPDTFAPDAPTRGSDPLLLYFTSGTTAKPKLVLHSHVSYPVGHLSSMYWIGLMPGDVHLNISSPGWAKHAYSCFFAPWLAEATVLVVNQSRFDAAGILDALVRERVTTFCAPPTVWRFLIQHDLRKWSTSLRELVSAGEPLNPEVIDQVREHWGLTIRDGYGQTETTLMIANTPGQPVVPGSMGRVMPGFAMPLRDVDGRECRDGEITVSLGSQRPVGLMEGYGRERGIEPLSGEWYRTGDTAVIDESGVFTYVGRADDVFKSSDYRISPFELESILIEHDAVAEAGVVPSPDSVRLSVPKAFVSLRPGSPATAATAKSILDHARDRLGPFKRIRRIEFCELPKTVSGKVKRAELRKLEAERRARNERGAQEWIEEDLAKQ